MSDRPLIGLVWAQAEGVIGRDGGMPWHVPEDLAHFREVTMGSPVLMGRATWDSLDPRYKPLPGRRNIVVTRQSGWRADGAEPAGSLESALELARAGEPEWIWVIGGGEVFAQAIRQADRLEVTELTHPGGFSPVHGDVRSPAIDPVEFAAAAGPESTSRTGIRYRFVRYDRVRAPERSSTSSRGRA